MGRPLPSYPCVRAKKSVLRFRSLQRFGLLQKYPAGAPVWGRRPVRWPCGQPAGCVGVQNAIARPRCWLKGCPTGCWPQSLEWSSSQRRSLVDAAATSTTSTPTANISMLVKHIDGGRGGRRPRATACAMRAPSAHRSKHRFCDGWRIIDCDVARAGPHQHAEDPARLKAIKGWGASG